MTPEEYEAADKCQLWAAAHCDKQPTCVVATRGTTKPGPVAHRTWRGWRDGKIHVAKYDLPQPHIIWLYRNHFNTVDVFNKQAVGPQSL